MLSFQEVQELIANTFFEGAGDIAGIVMFMFSVIAILAVTRNTFYALFIGMIMTMLFSILGILSVEITVLLIVVSVLGLAYTARSVWSN